MPYILICTHCNYGGIFLKDIFEDTKLKKMF